jgi:nucleotide-binding universal stress UspA family protein
MSSVSKTLLVPALKNILFPTDFSESSQAAIPFLCTIAKRYASTIHMVHVIASEPMLEIPLDIPPKLDADREVAQSAMRTLLAGSGFDKIPRTATVERGQLWKVLAAFIEEKSIDLIVLGTHGRHGLKKLVLGSVAEQVFRLARVPVLTVGPHVPHEGIANADFGTILFATDFSFGSERALPYAVSMAQGSNLHLILLHVVAASMEVVRDSFGNLGQATVEVSTEFFEDAVADARRKLEDLISTGTAQQLNSEVIVECGPAAEKILEVAKNKQADLIVMGAHRSSASSIVSHMPWATASTVVCQAHCPVLTVRS